MGIKIAIQISAEPSDEEITFVKQLGLQWVTSWVYGEKADYKTYVKTRQRLESAGLKLWSIGNGNVHNMEEVTLNLPGRDKKIEEYKKYLSDIGKAGIHYTTYAHMGNGIWSTEPEETRGGAVARAFDASKAQEGRWMAKSFVGPLTHGRVYTEDEIWENYEYFTKQVIPLAEKYDVKIGIHPDDPPALTLGGVPRCIFSNFEGYKRALEIAESDNVGICLCVGCWLEGGDLMGKDVLETIRYFGQRGKIFKVHFRNVNRPLPHFVETFVDDGYMKMYKVMRALREVKFNGVMIPDHIPRMVGGSRVGISYSVGYMKALLERANEEVEGS